ncbi:MAG: phosphate transport system permease protein [Leptospiraceae bacterium]|nr:MAG: phosphate transport system permease protein [Leptospiraceae bacterium]
MEVLPSEQKKILTQAINEGRDKVFSRYGKAPSKAFSEIFIQYILTFFGWLTVFVTIGIAYVLLKDGIIFFQKASIIEFFTGTEWAPFGEPKKLGVLPLVNGTLMVALGAIVISIPLGIGTAIFLTQFATRQIREILTPLIEILGGIPTVVYGYFALDIVTPILKKIFPEIEIFNALSASIVVGISLIPMITSLSSEAIRVVPKKIQNGAYALGLTKFHVITRITIPAALSGIIASIILAFARAIGETMAVTLAAGASPKMGFNYLESIQTMTAFIVQVSLGDTPAGSIEYYTIYAIGLTLFIITFSFNWIALQIVRKFREEYK